MKTYRVSKYKPDAKIEVLEIVKRTSKTIVFRKECFRLTDTENKRFREERETINSGYCIHFETLGEAITYCTVECNKAIEKASKVIEDCQARLKELGELSQRETNG